PPELGRLATVETVPVRLGLETRPALAGTDDGRADVAATLDGDQLVLAFGWRAEPGETSLPSSVVSVSFALGDGAVHTLARLRLPPEQAGAEGWTETTVEVPSELTGRTGRIVVERQGSADWSLFTAAPVLIDRRDRGPNVILISIDTLRSDRLGCYGYPRPTSPAIDAMAAAGALFKNAFAQSNWTLPSHYSMLTSLYPSAHGVNPDRWQFAGVRGSHETFRIRGSGREQTLAERLRAMGLFTAAITEGGWVDAKFGFDQGFASYVAHSDDRLAETTQRMTLAWLRAHRGIPFFLFVHTYQTHQPYHQPPPYDTMFVDRGHLGYALPGVRLSMQTLDRFKDGTFPPTAGDREAFSGLYDGEVRYVDAFVEALLAALEETGLDRRTVLLLTSDHGEELFEHGNFDHGGTLYDEVMRVPLILWGPGRIAAGKVIDTPVASLDVLPTLVELAGGSAGGDLQGRSLVPLLAGGDLEDRVLFAEGWADESVPLTSVWDGPLKVVFRGADLEVAELYDLSRDPSESVDLADRRPREIDRLRQLVLDWRQENARIQAVIGEARAGLDEESEKRLRALGYL
ncbi:MAG: sulfatase, partial [Thermoanaerobaculia bacterium]